MENIGKGKNIGEVLRTVTFAPKDVGYPIDDLGKTLKVTHLRESYLIGNEKEKER